MDKEERELQIKLAEEERKLQIKLAKLNTTLQITIAAVFGSIAVSAAFIVAGYQFGLDSWSTLSPKTVIAFAFFVFSGYVAIVGYRFLRKLISCEKEIEELK